MITGIKIFERLITFETVLSHPAFLRKVKHRHCGK